MTLEKLFGEPGILYVATPFSKYEPGLQAAAYDAARHTGHLELLGFDVFSPIVHFYHIALAARIEPRDHDFWMRKCKPFMDMASGLVVVKLSGWEESIGVMMEREEFRRMRKPIVFMEPLP